ncbi:MAG TPA: glycosyltransferase family 39 protein [Dehalococcoidia bacterium]|nr:glycosyltransferase family 39 protein [Dehalococcoidia bacterium]
MAVTTGPGSAIATRLSLVDLPDRRTLILVLGFALATALLRLPSFFEPPWHTDEGIFQAVAQRVATGGQLYADAWESKPPLFIYIYVAIIEVFGAGVLPLRIVSAVMALATELTLFCIALRFVDRRWATAAAALLAVCLAVPFWEGNLALTETFCLLPTCLGVLCLLRGEERPGRAGWLLLLAGGALFGAAVLIRQTTALVALGTMLWFMLNGQEWRRPLLGLTLGGAAVVLPVVVAFALFGSFYWFWDANVGFFFAYVPSGEQLPIHYRPLILLPVLATIVALAVYRRRGETPAWGLPALWLTLALAGALLTGRPYSHYFLQVFPPLALLAVLVAPQLRPSWRPRWSQAPAFVVAGTLALLWLGVVRPEFDGNYFAARYTKQDGYYANFAGWLLGTRDRDAYERYFDQRVPNTLRLQQTLERLGARGEDVYIWGEYPWLYALAGSRPATPYMTSFYTLLIPYLDTRLGDALAGADPRFIVTFADVWPKHNDETGVMQRRFATATRAVKSLLAERYVLVASTGRARVFERTLDRPMVGPRIEEEGPLVTGQEGESPIEDESMEKLQVSVRD